MCKLECSNKILIPKLQPLVFKCIVGFNQGYFFLMGSYMKLICFSLSRNGNHLPVKGQWHRGNRQYNSFVLKGQDMDAILLVTD